MTWLIEKSALKKLKNRCGATIYNCRLVDFLLRRVEMEAIDKVLWNKCDGYAMNITPNIVIDEYLHAKLIDFSISINYIDNNMRDKIKLPFKGTKIYMIFFLWRLATYIIHIDIFIYLLVRNRDWHFII